MTLGHVQHLVNGRLINKQEFGNGRQQTCVTVCITCPDSTLNREVNGNGHM